MPSLKTQLLALISRWREGYPVVRETLDVLGIAGLLVGGIFAAIQYVDAKAAQRTSRTFEYIERYESGDVAEARRAINRVLRPYLEQFEDLEAEGLPRKERDDVVRSIIRAEVEIQSASSAKAAGNPSAIESPETVEDKIDRVVEFYDGLKVCVDEELCNERVTVNYFSPDEARIFWDNFYPYIMDRRANYPRYGDALEAFAKKDVRTKKEG
ncbi:MAG: hypothetical protein EAY70_10615 [Sphingomonadales bacterium]|nr:MAG: hypothetical protein EAY70_10615 [Sphingomonadales bacterium]